jgi:hypothetical protein
VAQDLRASFKIYTPPSSHRARRMKQFCPKRLRNGAGNIILFMNIKIWQSHAESIRFYTIRNTEKYDADRGGDPKGVYAGYAALNATQTELLAKLPDDGSWVAVRKGGVRMDDLAALTASEEVEFAMFQKGQTQLIVRGNKYSISVSEDMVEKMARLGYEWTGHTHNGNNLVPSDSDRDFLSFFSQKESLIYNAKGESKPFNNLSYVW